MAVIHVTEAEAARDLPALLSKAEHGNEIYIDGVDHTFAVVPSPRSTGRGVLLSEVLADLRKNGSAVLLDDQWSDDLGEIIRVGQQERFLDWESS